MKNLSRLIIAIVNNAVLPRMNAQLGPDQQFLRHLWQSSSIEKFALIFYVIHFNCVVFGVVHQLVLTIELGMAVVPLRYETVALLVCHLSFLSFIFPSFLVSIGLDDDRSINTKFDMF